MKKQNFNSLWGGGALEPKTVVGQGIEANYTKKKKAFTLAEVLITLAIIGVVAALTIPTVVANYQKQVYYTGFMKVYNTINTALSFVTQENGYPDIWGIDPNNMNDPNMTKKYFYPHLKINKTCELGALSSCLGFNDSPLKKLDGQILLHKASDYYIEDKDAPNGVVAILSDGSILSIYYQIDDEDENSAPSVWFRFDTNGAKGPNTMGRDVFMMAYIFDSENDDNKGKWEWLDLTMLFDDDCKADDVGYSCSLKLLKDGKMTY